MQNAQTRWENVYGGSNMLMEYLDDYVWSWSWSAWIINCFEKSYLPLSLGDPNSRLKEDRVGKASSIFPPTAIVSGARNKILLGVCVAPQGSSQPAIQAPPENTSIHSSLSLTFHFLFPRAALSTEHILVSCQYYFFVCLFNYLINLLGFTSSPHLFQKILELSWALWLLSPWCEGGISIALHREDVDDVLLRAWQSPIMLLACQNT